jgi:hypothetical protein
MLQALKNLPRDARDTLFLLAVIAWVIAPQVSTLPTWCSVLAASLLLWRGYLAVSSRALPNRWWLMGLLLLATAATYITHRTLLGHEAGVTYIVVLLSLKTLEMRRQRDAFVVFFLGFFTLLSSFFISQSLPVAMAMLLGLLGLLTALVNSHMPVGRPPLMQAAKTAGWMALLVRRSWPHCLCCSRASRLYGAYPAKPQGPVAGFQPPCAWATSPAWHWTRASPCGCDLTALPHPRATSTSGAPC